MFKSPVFRYFVFGSIMSLLLLFTASRTVLAAWVNLNPGHSCAPTAGNLTWSQSTSSSTVTWYQYERWSGSQYTCIHGASNWYHLEAEAYNPGNPNDGSCDKLWTTSTSYTLPSSSSPTIANGCGLSTYPEETKFWISSAGVSNGVSYWTRTTNNKVNITVGKKEVNWSFSNLTSDWWMGKIGYTISNGQPYANYAPRCSTPSTILDGFSGCP